jgi:hypothetical protein
MIRMALTALALLGVATWLDGLDGAGTVQSTIILAAVFIAVAALFFCVLGAIS